jgi:hypothetical protein
MSECRVQQPTAEPVPLLGAIDVQATHLPICLCGCGLRYVDPPELNVADEVTASLGDEDRGLAERRTEKARRAPRAQLGGQVLRVERRAKRVLPRTPGQLRERDDIRRFGAPDPNVSETTTFRRRHFGELGLTLPRGFAFLPPMSWRQNRLIMTIIFAVFAAVSVVMVIVGDRSTQIVGLAALAMFGVGGLAWWIGEFRTERARTPIIGTVQLPRGHDSRALILPMRAGKQRTAVILLAAVAIGSLIFALSPESLGRRDGPLIRVVMLGVGAILGLFALRGVSGVRKGAYYLALTPSAVAVRSIAGDFAIPWHALASVHVFALHGQPYLGFDVTDDSAIRNDTFLGALDRLEQPLTGRHRSVWLGGFSAPPETVADLVRHYVESPAARASLGVDRVPDVLAKPQQQITSGCTSAEKRQLRSLGRWVTAFLLTAYGLFIGAILVGLISRILARESELSGGVARTAVAVGFLAVLLFVALAHFGAAVAIIRRRGIGRKMGLSLSVAGICIGVLGGAVAVATAAPQRAWTLVILTVVAYSVSLLALWLLRDPSEHERRPLA